MLDFKNTTLRSFAKRALADYSLTFLSSVATIGVIQIFVYPYVARVLDNQAYGLFLTLMGVANSLMPAFGSTLRNTRIVMNEEYAIRICPKSDFKRIACFVAPSVAVLSTTAMSMVYHMDAFNALIMAALLACGILKAYGLFVFRLPIDPRKNLKASLASCVGYLAGLPLVAFADWWFFPFLLAEALSLAYVLKESPIFEGSISASSLYPSALKMYSYLTITNLITYCSVYIDRILLYPLLGPIAVTTYYAASFVGKACTFLMSPLSTVLLSYISDGSHCLTVKRYDLLNGSILLGACIVGALLLAAAPLITTILYPDLVSDAMPFIYIGNAASLLGVVNGVNMVIVLKAAPAQWQLIISIAKLALYVMAALFAGSAGNLTVLCVALLFSNIAIYLMTYFVGRFYLLTTTSRKTPKG